MDLDAEMERLRKEARAKLDAQREAEPPADAERPAPDAPEIDEEALSAAKHLAGAGSSLSLGGKIATVLVGLVAAWLALAYVVAPLLKIAFVLAIIVAVVWVIMKLMTGDDEDGEKK
jgi:Flp pilus assembly protein TadB